MKDQSTCYYSCQLNDDSKLTLRFAALSDAPLIERFIKRLAEFEKLSHAVHLTTEKLEKTLFGPKAFAEVLIAERQLENSITEVGFALFFHNYSTFLAQPGIYLEDLFVLEEYRSLGIGKIIFKALARLALERNCGRLEWSVLNWNTRAIDFYKKLGSEEQSEWTVHRLQGQSLKNLAE